MGRIRPRVAVAAAVLWAAAGLVSADCTCSGLDYTNGGSYLVDGTSNKQFIFTSQFQGAYFLSNLPAAAGLELTRQIK